MANQRSDGRDALTPVPPEIIGEQHVDVFR
jgi:hypothetical protein